MKEEFDLASYPKSSPFYDPTNIKVVGKFKDEASGQSNSEFVGLMDKIYSYQTLNSGGAIHSLNDPSHSAVGFTTKNLRILGAHFPGFGLKTTEC